jgi:hypothetical protein
MTPEALLLCVLIERIPFPLSADPANLANCARFRSAVHFTDNIIPATTWGLQPRVCVVISGENLCTSQASGQLTDIGGEFIFSLNPSDDPRGEQDEDISIECRGLTTDSSVEPFKAVLRELC